jgi:hypothetical protein
MEEGEECFLYSVFQRRLAKKKRAFARFFVDRF